MIEACRVKEFAALKSVLHRVAGVDAAAGRPGGAGAGAAEGG